MSRFTLRRPSPALVVSVVALVVALGGTSYAAFTLPKNSVGTRQLKNKAVTPAKVAPKTIALFKGEKGDRGPQGAQGAQGVQGPHGTRGPVGPSNGYFAKTFGSTVSLPVPAGDYMVYGQGFVGNTTLSSVQASCFLSANGSALSAQNGSNNVTIPPFPGNGEVSDEGVAHLSAAGELENTCNGGGGTPFGDAITAIKVDTASP